MRKDNGNRDRTRQKRFIETIQIALGRDPARPVSFADIFPEPEPGKVDSRLQTVRNRSDQQRQALLTHLKAQGKPLNLDVVAVKDIAAAADSIAALVREKKPEWGAEKQVAAWQHPLVGELNLTEKLAGDGIPVFVTKSEGTHDEPDQRSLSREQVARSFVGITSADYCLADTATLVMKTRAGQARSVSLVPSIHIAVIRLEQVLADLKELYTVLRRDLQAQSEDLTNCMTFISGPSKTGDIELVMVHGAHGPREVYIYVITG